MCEKCSRCGEPIGEDEPVYVIDSGLPSETIVCESCNASMCENGIAIQCESCGAVFFAKSLHDEALDEKHTFTPCPTCHKDVVDCLTREEMLDDIVQLRYAVVVGFIEGRDRGFIVHADNRGEAIGKLLDVLRQSNSGLCIASITVSEILLKEDEIK